MIENRSSAHSCQFALAEYVCFVAPNVSDYV